VTWNDGDEIDPATAKAETASTLADPAHTRPSGSPDDLATIDDPIVDDDGTDTSNEMGDD